jgi:stress-induced morphogen
MIDPNELQQKLLVAFPDAEVEVKDLTGTKDHYRARIVSSAFAGKSRIEQHRMVYAAVGEAMNGPVHALALETLTPEAVARAKTQS